MAESCYIYFVNYILISHGANIKRNALVIFREEELSYLDFITEVTNDVLTRGIFTNRVLCNVFEEHVQKNKAKLDEDRMRSMLDNLREDLGIDSHPPFRENPEDVGMGSSRPPVRSKTKTTGYAGDASQFRNVRVGSREGEKGKASGDVVDSYRQLGGAELQSLTDIVEVSEKTASVSSIKSSSRKAAPDTPSKEMDDALIDLLGLNDVPDTSVNPPASFHAQKAEKSLIDTFSIKSAVSSHPSEQAYKQSVDPLQDYAQEMALENSDKASVRSAISRASKASTLKGNKSDSSHELPSNSTHKALSHKSTESLSKASSDAPYVTMVRKSSVDSTERSTVSRKSSAEGERHPPTVSRQSSGESVTRSSAETRNAKAIASLPSSKPSTIHAGSDEGDDLESNAAFGKTTLFGKTRNLGLTYKALSQASDEDDEYSDNFSDKGYDEDGAF
ncbi:uncharacterized protein [Watersipora subatra]|uniref:uncharacterized protein n=1 Tax=Watersipora subatra TaxID=2589382 RepID=UPI00355B696D